MTAACTPLTTGRVLWVGTSAAKAQLGGPGNKRATTVMLARLDDSSVQMNVDLAASNVSGTTGDVGSSCAEAKERKMRQ